MCYELRLPPILEQQPTFQAGKEGEPVVEANLERHEGHLDSCPMTDDSC